MTKVFPKVLICGGRNFNYYKIFYYILNHIFSERGLLNLKENDLPSVRIIHGGARGADSLADRYAVTSWCLEKEYKADWEKYGKSAGFIRNKQMLEEGKPDLVIAFPGGKGTKMMVELAKKEGIEVIDFNDN